MGKTDAGRAVAAPPAEPILVSRWTRRASPSCAPCRCSATCDQRGPRRGAASRTCACRPAQHAGRRGRRLRHQPGPARPGPHPPLHALDRRGRAGARAAVPARAARARRSASRVAERANIQDWIAEARIELEMVRLLTLKTAWLMDTVGNKARRAWRSRAIKVAAPNVALKILDRAIQVHGGGGVSRRLPAGRAGTPTCARCAWPTAPTRCTRCTIALHGAAPARLAAGTHDHQVDRCGRTHIVNPPRAADERSSPGWGEAVETIDRAEHVALAVEVDGDDRRQQAALLAAARAGAASRKPRALTSRAIDLRGAGDVSTQWLTSSSEPAVPPRLGRQRRRRARAPARC